MRDPQLIIGKDHLVGVEAVAMADGTWSFNWAHVQRRKGAVRILRQGEGVADPVALGKAIGPRYPLALVVRSDRFLLRHVTGDFDTARDLPKLLPNVEARSLAIEVIAHEKASHIAIARKEGLDPLLDQMTAAGLRITSLFIGPMVMLALADLLPPKADRSRIAGHEFLRDEGRITGYRYPKDTTPGAIAIGDEQLGTSCALAMAAAWQTWFHVLDHQEAGIQTVSKGRREERYRINYERGQVVLLVALLALVAFDMGLRQRLGRDRGALEGMIAAQEAQRSELDALERMVQDRAQLLTLSGGQSHGAHVRMIDRIAASVPAGITLDELWLAPLEGPLRKDKGFVPRSGTLRVIGSLRDPGELTKWIKTLEDQEGIREARLLNLEQRDTDPLPTFELEIDLS